jgi:biopolymer transport protein ExbD
MPLKTNRDEQPTLNLTPMIDIVFLLIIFFMVGTKFTELERKLSVQPPLVANAAPLTVGPQKKIVDVFRDGRIALDRQEVSLSELVARLVAARAEYQDLGVLIRGDGEGPFQNVASVLSACHEAEISKTAISVRLPRSE